MRSAIVLLAVLSFGCKSREKKEEGVKLEGGWDPGMVANEVDGCAEAVMTTEGNVLTKGQGAYSCSCLYEKISKEYSYDEYLVEGASIMKKMMTNGVAKKCTEEAQTLMPIPDTEE
jgi:hypothetical protein